MDRKIANLAKRKITAMELDTSHWTKEEFLAFLLLYIANSDTEIQEEEKEYIARKINAKQMDEMMHITANCSDKECIDLISSLRSKFYPGVRGKNQLIKEMKDLTMADGVLNPIEKFTINTLERLL